MHHKTLIRHPLSVYTLGLLICLTTSSINSRAQTQTMVIPEASGGIAYIDINSHNTWENATYELQTAINSAAANGGGSIWIAKGTYLPTTLLAGDPGAPVPPLLDPENPDSDPDARQASFVMASNVTVQGGFEGTESSPEQRPSDLFGSGNTVILSGDIGIDGDNSDNAYHIVIFPPDTDETAILQDVMITKGNANGGYYFSSTGAGIHLREGGTVRHCIITDNLSGGKGGGVYIYKGGTVENSKIFENQATDLGGGAYINLGGEILFSDIYSNICTTGNGGGVFITSDGTDNGKVSHSRILANQSGGKGGGAGTYLGGDFINNIIANNKTDGKGGGIFLQFGGLVLNNTVISNHGEQGGGIFVNDGGEIHNSVLWGNKTPYGLNLQLSIEDDDQTERMTTADFCAIQNGNTSTSITNLIVLNPENTGTGNHPHFINPVDFHDFPLSPAEVDEILNADYSFDLASALLDSGNPDDENLSIPEVDIAKNARVVKSAIDIGAYEILYYTVESTVDNGTGSIVPEGPVKILPGENILFTIIPGEGMNVASFAVNNTNLTADMVDEGESFSYLKSVVYSDLFATVDFGISNLITDHTKNKILVHPNPAEEVIFFEGIKINALKIFSIKGQIVKSLHEPSSAGINISNLKKGLYFLELIDENNARHTLKFIKQ